VSPGQLIYAQSCDDVEHPTSALRIERAQLAQLGHRSRWRQLLRQHEPLGCGQAQLRDQVAEQCALASAVRTRDQDAVVALQGERRQLDDRALACVQLVRFDEPDVRTRCRHELSEHATTQLFVHAHPGELMLCALQLSAEYLDLCSLQQSYINREVLGDGWDTARLSWSKTCRD